ALQRTVNAPLDRGQSCLMKDAIDPLNRAVHGRRVYNIALDQLDPIAERSRVGQIAGAEVIEHADAIAAPHEGFRNMGTDKPGAAGYEESSHEGDSRWKMVDSNTSGKAK